MKQAQGNGGSVVRDILVWESSRALAKLTVLRASAPDYTSAVHTKPCQLPNLRTAATQGKVSQ